jgi:acyl dehydratase
VALVYETLRRLESSGHHFRYTDRETMLYALSIGFGPAAGQLPFVYERPALQTVPTMAVVLASTGLLQETGVNMTKVLHGAQALTVHRPLPPAADLIASSRVVEAYDRGPEKGAVLLLETSATLEGEDQALFSSIMTIIARADGGFGGSKDQPPVPHTLPVREPDETISYRTRDDQALLYRLNRDRNPLHADPAFAAKAGFDRPILHGLCSYGIACGAIIKALGGNTNERIKKFEARFSAPAYPGDNIETDLWIENSEISFRSRVPERNAVILNNGRCVLATP